MSFRVGADAYDRFMGRYSVPLGPLLADLGGVAAGQRGGVVAACIWDYAGVGSARYGLDPFQSSLAFPTCASRDSVLPVVKLGGPTGAGSSRYWL